MTTISKWTKLTDVTDAEIDAFTMADVAAAKQRSEEAMITRCGSSTIDYVLCGVNGKSHTLEAAKAHLIRIKRSEAAKKR